MKIPNLQKLQKLIVGLIHNTKQIFVFYRNSNKYFSRVVNEECGDVVGCTPRLVDGFATSSAPRPAALSQVFRISSETLLQLLLSFLRTTCSCST